MRFVTHHRSADLGLHEYACPGSNRHPGRVETVVDHELIFVRRGVFKLWIGRRERLVTPNEILFLPPGAEYAVSHPVAGGDDCTIVTCAPSLIEPLRHTSPMLIGRATPALFRDQLSLFAAVARGAGGMEVEESLYALVGKTLKTLDASVERNYEIAAPLQRRYVRRAQELIATHCTENLPLSTVGQLSGLSPFHLSRLFRRLTGSSIHQYQTGLRLRLALTRLQEGASDIAGLALDLGYSSHSHFTSAFRREYGLSPTEFRSVMRPPR